MEAARSIGSRKPWRRPTPSRARRPSSNCLAIDTPAALPALELVLAPASQKEAVLAAEAIGRIRGPEASLSLARLAVFANWEEARKQAAEQLKSRPLVEFVPPMLAAMATPLVDVSWDVVFRADGTALATQKFSRERQAVTEVKVVQTWYSRSDGGQGPLPAWLTGNFWGVLEETAWDQHNLAFWQNLQSEALNLRIADALNHVTDQELSSDAEAWWSWWDGYNETRASEKPVVQSYYSQVRVTCSCFAAGTPVWTIDGPRPIERIAIGDLVLAQNAETGELAFKPVLRTTIGSPIELVTVKAGEDTIQCTGGHAFWVPGSGWTHAAQARFANPRAWRVGHGRDQLGRTRTQREDPQPDRGRLEYVLRRPRQAAGP